MEHLTPEVVTCSPTHLRVSERGRWLAVHLKRILFGFRLAEGDVPSCRIFIKFPSTELAQNSIICGFLISCLHRGTLWTS